jgi:hypothetical protein
MVAVEFILKDSFYILADNAKGVPFQTLHQHIKKKKSNKNKRLICSQVMLVKYLLKSKSMILLTKPVLSAEYITVC